MSRRFVAITCRYAALFDFQISHLKSLSMVQNVKTEVPMEKIKLTTELPV